MTSPYDTNAKLEDDVEQLRLRFTVTQELYREVAALLFFRYGITPTANKLYQLVKKGSMSAPAQALQQFWQDLREKSRVRIGHADIPEMLNEQAGEFISQLWNESIKQAQISYQDFYDQAKEKVEHASAALETAKLALQDKNNQLRHTLEQLSASQQQEQLHKEEIAALRQTLLHSQQSHQALLAEKETLGATLQTQQAQFTSDLDNLQKSIALTEERARASERMALLEIDKERSLRTKTEKNLNQTIEQLHAENKAQSLSLQQQRETNAVINHELEALRKQLEKADHRRDSVEVELTHLQKELAKHQTQLAVIKQENTFLSQNNQDLQQRLAQEQEKRRVVLPRRHRYE